MISLGTEVDDTEPSDAMFTDEVTPLAETVFAPAMEEID